MPPICKYSDFLVKKGSFFHRTGLLVSRKLLSTNLSDGHLNMDERREDLSRTLIAGLYACEKVTGIGKLMDCDYACRSDGSIVHFLQEKGMTGDGFTG